MTADSFSFARTADDARILDLFRQWCAVMQGSSDPRDDVACDAQSEAECALRCAIFDAPAETAVGFAIKAYMVAKSEFDFLAPPPGVDGKILSAEMGADLGYPHEWKYGGVDRVLYLGTHGLKRMIEDAARVVPELRPLAETVIRSPVALPALAGRTARTADATRG